MNQELREQFFTAMSRYKKIASSFTLESKISINELAILKIIAGDCKQDENCSMNLNVPKIQQRLQITKPAVSYILNTLEKKGYIIRQIDPNDRRKIAMTATVEGKMAVEQFSMKMDDAWNLLLNRFGAENMKKLVGDMLHLTELCEEILEEGNHTN